MRNRNDDWIERQIKTLHNDIANMEENNDGSLNWVDEIREMYSMIDDLERMLARKGGTK